MSLSSLQCDNGIISRTISLRCGIVCRKKIKMCSSLTWGNWIGIFSCSTISVAFDSICCVIHWRPFQRRSCDGTGKCIDANKWIKIYWNEKYAEYAAVACPSAWGTDIIHFWFQLQFPSNEEYKNALALYVSHFNEFLKAFATVFGVQCGWTFIVYDLSELTFSFDGLCYRNETCAHNLCSTSRNQNSKITHCRRLEPSAISTTTKTMSLP